MECSGLWKLKLKDGTNNEAKLLALKCIKRCWGRKIILEGDSIVVVQAVSKNSIHAWHLGNLLESIMEELNGFEEFKTCHVFREDNREVDALSK